MNSSRRKNLKKYLQREVYKTDSMRDVFSLAYLQSICAMWKVMYCGKKHKLCVRVLILKPGTATLEKIWIWSIGFRKRLLLRRDTINSS